MPQAKTKAPEIATLRVDLDGRYAGWWADCDDDPDWGFVNDLLGALQTNQLTLVSDALLRVLVQWNFTAKDGTAAPLTADGMRVVPARAVMLLAKTYVRQWSELPN